MTGLEYYRNEAKLSLQDIASVLNISRQSIYQWEHKSSKIPENRLIELSKLLNVSVEFISQDINNDFLLIRHLEQAVKYAEEDDVREKIQDVIQDIATNTKRKEAQEKMNKIIKDFEQTLIESDLDVSTLELQFSNKDKDRVIVTWNSEDKKIIR